MIFTYLTMRDAVQEGAAYASIVFGLDDDLLDTQTEMCNAIRDRVEDNLPLYQNYKQWDVRINNHPCHSNPAFPPCSGDVVSISVTTDFDLTMPIISSFVGTTVPLTASITDTLLSPYCP